MDLHDYPRPKDDTGIGVHWNAGFPVVVGLGKIKDFWLPELIAMGVKWVKIARHDGGLEFAELLLKNDIMPIVRLYRPQPNPGTLGEAALRIVSDYVSAGVRYFEFNNEPDLGVEWQDNYVPPDAQQIVARNAIVDIEAILARGGYPGIPALAPGTKWDLVGEICRLGRRDLFSEPVWQAIHNYSLNHPLDYPYDPGNQRGAPYTQAFYDQVAMDNWGGNAWGGWDLERVNRERREHANPGATAFDDPSCWRNYERYDKLIRDQIGRSLPLLTTENGYIVGERPDPRYPATTPQLHMAQTLEACRIMMGTSSRFDHAPDYYFCTAFWLLGNYTLGHWAPEWEGQAWYSTRWPGGQLPIVAALKAEPKQVRTWRGDAGLAGQVTGIVQGGAGLTIRLQRADGWAASTQADANGRYKFTDVPLAEYLVTVVEADRSQSVNLTRARPVATANFDLTNVVIAPESSTVHGNVRGGAGLNIQLARVADGWSQEQTVAEDGSYSFTNLRAGTYMLNLANSGVARAGIELDGQNEVEVDLVAPGWGWEVADGGASPGFGVVRCRVTKKSGLPVHLWTTGWSGMIQRTGSKAEYGTDACEFAPLGAGTYLIQPENIDIKAQVVLDGSRVVWVTFSETEVQPAQKSVISGRVRGGAGRTLTLTGPAGEQTTTVAHNASFRFGDLPAGIYRLSVAGTDIAQDNIVLDGHNRVTVNLDVPEEPETPATASIITGTVTNGTGRTLRLLQPPATEVLAEVQVGSDGSYRFEKLAAGIYTVLLMAADPAAGVAEQRSGIELDGHNQVQVDFTLSDQASAWHWRVEDGGAGPGFSLVRCQVVDRPNVNVRLWTSGWGGITQHTGSKPEYGPDVCEFAPLGPGLYFLKPAGADVQAEVRLESNQVAWVRFQPPGSEPSTPAASKASVIAGTVVNGDGLLVSLAGPAGEQHTTIRDGHYRFEGLAAGTYRVAILAADPALGEAETREGITLDGTNQVTVDFELPSPDRAESSVTGRVRGGAGRTLILEGAGETFTTTVAEDETYSFTGLPAGTYRATVQDTDPPTGSTQTQAGIELDGTNTVQVDFDLGVLGSGKSSEHYLLVGSTARSRADFLAVLQYVSRFQPTVGNDEEAARRARHVTILGSTSAISAMVEQGLRMSGCQVQRIESDYAEKLGKLLEEDRPY